MNRVLVIDDDIELCQLLTEYLEPEGLNVRTVQNGNQGIEEALSGDYELIVLDVMLPGINGFDILRRIRASSNMPVLMLTARGDDVDRIVGLEMGADDYLPKPFNPRELVARIRAILRRSKQGIGKVTAAASEMLAVGDIELDTGTWVVRKAGKPVELTAVEFNLLEALLRAAGQVVMRDELAKIVLGRNLSSYDRSIDVHVSNLRKKLGHKFEGNERIKTVRGAGYMYSLPPEPTEKITSAG
jgi:two-component system response regulator CpxR